MGLDFEFFRKGDTPRVPPDFLVAATPASLAELVANSSSSTNNSSSTNSSADGTESGGNGSSTESSSRDKPLGDVPMGRIPIAYFWRGDHVGGSLPACQPASQPG